VEDPNDDFQDMRDLSDLKFMLSKPEFSNLTLPMTLNELNQIQKQCKLSKVVFSGAHLS
jgi:hypothetical protein